MIDNRSFLNHALIRINDDWNFQKIQYSLSHIGLFTMKKTFNSNKSEIVKNTAYITRQTNATVLDKTNLDASNIQQRTQRLANKLITVQASPSEFTCTNHSEWCPLDDALTRAFIIHGIPKHTKISKVLDPMLFETAIEP